MLTKINAASVPMKEVIIHGNIISDGFVAFCAALYPMMDVGMSVKPAACRHKNMIWLLLAFPLSSFTSCMLSMAFKPKGVAALSRPKKLAAKFMVIKP